MTVSIVRGAVTRYPYIFISVYSCFAETIWAAQKGNNEGQILERKPERLLRRLELALSRVKKEGTSMVPNLFARTSWGMGSNLMGMPRDTLILGRNKSTSLETKQTTSETHN